MDGQTSLHVPQALWKRVLVVFHDRECIEEKNMTEKKNPQNKASERNPLDVDAERAEYRNRRILGFWHSAVSPVFQQVLGPDLSRELDARLETNDPWCDAKESRKEGEAAFICRLSTQCGVIMAVLETLSTRPETMSVEDAIEVMGQTAPTPESRKMLGAMLELEPKRLIEAGVVEFCDTVAEIHSVAHGGGMPAAILIDVIRVGR